MHGTLRGGHAMGVRATALDDAGAYRIITSETLPDNFERGSWRRWRGGASPPGRSARGAAASRDRPDVRLPGDLPPAAT
jgi:hypothetical protein